MGRLTPYQPMRPATPEVSMSRMQEILARNAHVDVKVESPKKEPLQWQKPVKTGTHGQGYMLSECGQFSVTKDMHELGFSYTAWDIRPKKLGQMATNLGCVRTREEAEKLCEAVR
jgi:hypothetical protein